MTLNFDHMLHDLIHAANEHQKLMDGTTAPVKKILDSADIVWAVFNEPDGSGVGTLIIKGNQVLEEAAEGLWPGDSLRCTAIATVDRKVAIATRLVLGDGYADEDMPFPEDLI